ncbi:hypothetical protein LOZ53_006593 [Ophidiomyces ophidiicola]|nr:hypothetical protein LOZ53_006593 [Ophidiomyces ophidiicola]
MFLQLIRDTHTVLDTTDSDAVHIYFMTFALELICQSGKLMERMEDHSAHHSKTDFKIQLNVQSSDVPQPSDKNCADVIMAVHTQFLHLIKIYKLIKTGTKHGNVELLFWRLLQDAVMTNSLMTVHQSTEHFMKTDKLNELLNLKLKKLLQSQRTSTFRIQKFFWKSIYTLKYTHQLHQAVEHAFEKYTDSKHVKKSASGDICSLTSLISEQLCVSVDDKSGFLSNLKPFNIFQNLSSHVATVNAYITKILETGGVGASDENERDTDDIGSCREDAAEIGYLIIFCVQKSNNFEF